MTQTYATHRHTPTPTYVATVFWFLSVVGFALRWFYVGGRYSMALGIGGLLATTFMTVLISRDYTTKLQDRIIKLEMRVRTASLLSPAQQAALFALPKSRIIALRFASDEELPALIERARAENLTSDQIKRAIRTWVPDVDRT